MPVARCHLDEPAGSAVVTRPVVVVRGWISSSEGPISEVQLAWGAAEPIPLAVADRPDVRDALPDEWTAGFESRVTVDPAWRGPVSVQWRADGSRRSQGVEITIDAASVEDFLIRKRRKLDRIRPFLRCPACGAELVAHDGSLVCGRDGCGDRYQAGPMGYDMMGTAFRSYGGITETSNVSAHPYTPETQQVVDDHADGLVLDAGAGLRPEYLDHVVNLDVVAYDSTDVLGIGERLPFADGTFDAVISIAVLEHVRHPFECARELERVLKPGGTLLVMVPFLQPFHGYPDHYYNMTANGLRNLFSDIDVDAQYVPESGVPIFTLTWFLDVWARGLPPQIAERFRAMTVGELAGADPFALQGHPFVAELSPGATEELASTTCLIGRKVAGDASSA